MAKCQYPLLPDEYQAQAAEEDRMDRLDIFQARCKCGAQVGALKSNMFPGRYRPTSHEEAKPRRSPPRKPGGGKS